MASKIIAVLDIGTSKVACVAAELGPDGSATITGAGRAPIEGCLREGVLLDVEGVSGAVEKAVREAEILLSSDIQRVYLSVSGAHVRGFSGSGTVTVGKPDEFDSREISPEDVRRAEEAARAVGLPPGCRVLDVVKRGYSVDGFDRLSRPPLRLRAEQLTASVYTIIADRTAVFNLEAAVDGAGLEVAGIFPSALASAYSVLTPDEIEMGVAVADIGAGTTDVAVFKSGTPAHVGVVPLGGNDITSDLQSLRIPWEQAERIKQSWAVASTGLVDPNQSMKVMKLGGRGTFTLSHPIVSQMVNQRVEEIFEGVSAELSKSGIDPVELPAGLVLTGGTSRLPGIPEVAGRITGLPAELGVPVGMATSTEMILAPEFATGVGLLVMACTGPASGTGQRSSRLGDLMRKIGGVFSRLR
jgi:cell division protein FtsA